MSTWKGVYRDLGGFNMIDPSFWYTEEGHRLLLLGGARVARRMGYPQTAKAMEHDAEK